MSFRCPALVLVKTACSEALRLHTRKPESRVTGSGLPWAAFDTSTPESARVSLGATASPLAFVLAVPGTTTPPGLGFVEDAESFLPMMIVQTYLLAREKEKDDKPGEMQSQSQFTQINLFISSLLTISRLISDLLSQEIAAPSRCLEHASCKSGHPGADDMTTGAATRDWLA